MVFVLTVAGTSTVIGLFRGWAPEMLLNAVVDASIFGHFTAITRGVIDLRDITYFVSLMVASLCANALLVDLRKAD